MTAYSFCSMVIFYTLQLIFSAFKTLTNQTVTVELKNDLAVRGTLKSVDQFLNFRLDDLKVVEGDEHRWPHFVGRLFLIVLQL